MKIRRLAEGTINRIAAGEVVERPASAVKELVENALDAGATRIDIAASNGGCDLVLVEDDGEGMEADDLVLAVERHATSKLARRRSFAYRDPGLPRRGAALHRRGGAAFHRQPHAEERGARGPRRWRPRQRADARRVFAPRASRGTRVEVRELFFATPARLKFLKSARSEDLATQRYRQAAGHGAARCRLHA